MLYFFLSFILGWGGGNGILRIGNYFLKEKGQEGERNCVLCCGVSINETFQGYAVQKWQSYRNMEQLQRGKATNELTMVLLYSYKQIGIYSRHPLEQCFSTSAILGIEVHTF